MGKFDNVKFKKSEMSPTWDFRTDKEIVGILVDIEENVGENNSMLYTLEIEDGSRIAVWGSTILDVRLKNTKIGEVVKIKYLGKEKSEKRKGATYNNFEVFHGELTDLEEELKEPEDGTDLEEALEELKKK